MTLRRRIKLLFTTVNPINSSMSVDCIESGKCGYRHSELCKTCSNNIDAGAQHSCYKQLKPKGFWKKIYIKLLTVNPINSDMSVRCIESEKCCHRHSELCKSCDNNIGEEAEHYYYTTKM